MKYKKEDSVQYYKTICEIRIQYEKLIQIINNLTDYMCKNQLYRKDGDGFVSCDFELLDILKGRNEK